MNRPHRKKTFNTLNAASLARWIVITSFCALTGLIYVSRSIELHNVAAKKAKLEKELIEVRKARDVANDQITVLTSRSALQRRLKEGYLKMVPIAEQNIVRLNPADENAIQPVANQQASR